MYFFKAATTAVVGLGLTAAANAQLKMEPVTVEQSVRRIGTTSLEAPSSFMAHEAPSKLKSVGRVAPKPDLREGLRQWARANGVAEPGTQFPDASRAFSNPNPTPKAIGEPGPYFSGFSGLTIYQHVQVNGFALEPPDQGLAVGNGLVAEIVNDVVAVYDTSGNLVAGPASVNAFFKTAPAFNPATGVYGPSFTDPRAYFDQALQRWFVTSAVLDVDAAGYLTGRTQVYIAVSTSAVPFAFNILSIDTTDDGTMGTPAHAGCPCLPDQPLIGADKFGFYISTNEFPLFSPGFNGSQIYAMSKNFLAEGGLPTVVHFSGLQLAEGIAYSVQPAESLKFANGPASGVEYFLSSLDFQGTLDNRIAVWAMTDTATLNDLHPSAKLSHEVITSEVYGQPPPAVQNPGYYPYGLSLGEELAALDTNDDRMNQVVYEDGKLWAGLNTIVGGGGTNPDGTEDYARCGIAYFLVSPSINNGSVRGTIASQGYVAAPGQDSILFPSIGVTPTGKAAMTFTLVGPSPTLLFSNGFYPSMAYTRLSATSAPGVIRVGASGYAPEDGFSGYPSGVARWGDYTAAVADADGSIWMAAEWIPNTPRVQVANWGTFIGKIQ